MTEQPLTYRESGVDIDTAASALKRVAEAIRATHGSEVVASLGSFGGLYEPDTAALLRPLLVSSIDGVGTKTKVAAMLGSYQGLGHDIVNHCVNDILCQGARPLFFLDYFGCSNLHPDVFAIVLQGAAEACATVQCALIGGETAEMPGVYADGEIDLVGAIVGVVDFDRKLPQGKIQNGDLLIGIASNGLHTNGFSLARKALFEAKGYSVHDQVPGLDSTIGEELLRPHRCYYRSVYPLISETDSVLGIAHITGGGLYENLPRVMPSPVRAIVERRSWTPLPIFRMIQEAGNVPDVDMFRTFNMGIGMVLFVQKDAAPAVLQRLHNAGEMAAVIGELQRGPHDVQIV